ncbi:MAG: 2-oxo acid dehydrogenase subunit E2, partial [Treponema sp.]|nr:2-oxo acid dehydrogenase subunit E2 [Treponema sp.]
MTHILIMPRQGNTVESCIITDWKVKEGDAVSAETVVCEVETDKASFEIPAGAAGTILKILRNAGDDVPVLEPIAVIGAAGEDWQATVGASGGAVPDRGNGEQGTGNYSSEAALVANTTTPLPTPPISPRARNLAEKGTLPLPVSGTGPGG